VGTKEQGWVAEGGESEIFPALSQTRQQITQQNALWGYTVPAEKCSYDGKNSLLIREWLLKPQ